MASHKQWQTKFPEHKRLMWITGAESVLVDRVLAAELGSRLKHEGDIIKLDAADEKEADLLYSLQQVPHTSERIVIIKNANHIKNWDRFLEWLRTYNTTLQLFMVSYEDKPDTTETRFKYFISAGRYVECKQIKDLAEFISETESIRGTAAVYLVHVCGGDFRKCVHALNKLRALDVEITAELVRKYISRNLSEQFVEHLYNNNKKDAFECISYVKRDEYRKVLGFIEYKLKQLFVYVPLKRKRLRPEEISERIGIPRFYVDGLAKQAEAVDNKKLSRWVHLLVKVDSLIKQNVFVGVLEYLVVSW